MREVCRQCQTPLEPGWTFCTACGASIEGMSEPLARPDDGLTRPIVRPRGRKLAFLVVKSGSDQGKSVQLGDTTAVGAERNGNGLVLSDRFTSARHGLVRLEDGVYVYHDLASLNGSWLLGRNGDKRRITSPLTLMHGDTIEMGRSRIVYMEAGK